MATNVDVNISITQDGAVNVKRDIESIGDSMTEAGKRAKQMWKGFSADAATSLNSAKNSAAVFMGVMPNITRSVYGTATSFGQLGVAAKTATTSATTSMGTLSAAVEKVGAAALSVASKVRTAATSMGSFVSRAMASAGAMRNVGTAAKTSGFNVANLAAQFNDIGVTAAMSMSPLQIALQQGTQISQVLGPMGAAGAVRALGGAFMSVISPLSLLTIGMVAAVASGIQLVDWTKLMEVSWNWMKTNIPQVTVLMALFKDTMKLVTTEITQAVTWFRQLIASLGGFPSIVQTLRPVLVALGTAFSLVFSQMVLSMIKSITIAIGVGLFGAISSVFKLIMRNPIVSALSLIAVAVDYIVTQTIGWKAVLEAVIPWAVAVKDAIVEWMPTIKEFWDFTKPAFETFIQLLNNCAEGWVFIWDFVSKKLWPVLKDVFAGWGLMITDIIDKITKLIGWLKQAYDWAKRVMAAVAGAGGGAPSGGGAVGAQANYGGSFIAGKEPVGFNYGGGMKVGGTGSGRDTTPVAFRANRGERVTVETRRQQRENANSNSPQVTVETPLAITNVFDPNIIPEGMQTVAGTRAIRNVIAANRDEIAAILGVA